jgi:hypothetical protein
MKASVLIVLIICGTLLLSAPALMDHFRDSDQLAMTNASRLAFWFGGLLALTGAIVGFFMDGRHHMGPK